MADKSSFDPYGAAATYVGKKAEENPACSDADVKLLKTIEGHGSASNFESLGGALEAAGDTVEKLSKTSKHHAEIAKNEKEKVESALAAERAKKDLDAEKSTAADDKKLKETRAKRKLLEEQWALAMKDYSFKRQKVELQKKAVYMKLVDKGQLRELLLLTPEEAVAKWNKMSGAQQKPYLVGGGANCEQGAVSDVHFPVPEGIAGAIDCGDNTAFAVCETVQKSTLRVLASRHASVGHLI